MASPPRTRTCERTESSLIDYQFKPEALKTRSPFRRQPPERDIRFYYRNAYCMPCLTFAASVQTAKALPSPASASHFFIAASYEAMVVVDADFRSARLTAGYFWPAASVQSDFASPSPERTSHFLIAAS